MHGWDFMYARNYYESRHLYMFEDTLLLEVTHFNFCNAE